MTHRLPADAELFGQLFLPKGGLRIQCPREYLFRSPGIPGRPDQFWLHACFYFRVLNSEFSRSDTNRRVNRR